MGGWVGGLYLHHIVENRDFHHEEAREGEDAPHVVVLEEEVEAFHHPSLAPLLFLWVDGWVGGWVGGLDRGGRGGWNEVLYTIGGWVGGWVEGRRRITTHITHPLACSGAFEPPSSHPPTYLLLLLHLHPKLLDIEEDRHHHQQHTERANEVEGRYAYRMRAND